MCCLRPMWGMQAMSMRDGLHRAGNALAWSSWGRSAHRTPGKPRPQKALLSQDVRLIVQRKRPPALKGTQVSSGRKCMISMGILSSPFALREKRVASARAARCVLVLKRNPDQCPCVRKRNFFRFNAGVSSEKPRNFRSPLPNARGSKELIGKRVRALGLRQSRSSGWPTVSVQHALTAAALTLLRLDTFLPGAKMEQTRISHCAALAPKKAASCCPTHEFATGINGLDFGQF
jgi:hypothetical protein